MFDTFVITIKNMKKINSFFEKHYKEILLQVIIHIVLFLFYSYNLHNKSIFAPYKIFFFLNYATAALVINYILLPKFYYTKKFLWAFILFVKVLIAIILIDEFVLEQIYFPTTRGTYFPGITFTLVETLPIIIIFVGFKLAWDAIKKQSEVEALKDLVKESELQFLKSQINPHFLFNNLNNLYSYSIEQSPKTPSIILELSSVLRYMLYDCRENFVSLNKEIQHLKHFTALNELQVEDRGSIVFKHSKDIPVNYSIAPLILNVFIENAFKHSTNSQFDNIKIDIDISINEKGVLKFTCKNNFQTNDNINYLSKGIGLENVKKRLNLLYPNKHGLSIDDTNNIYSVVLLMNLKPS